MTDNNRRYLSVFSQEKPWLGSIGTYDSKEKLWVKAPECLRDSGNVAATLNHYFGEGIYGYLSPHKDLLNARFDRNTRGEIVEHSRPTKVTLQDIIRLTAGAPEAIPQIVVPLQIRKPSTRVFAKRRIPDTVFTEELLAKAARMKDAGMIWRDIGKVLEVNPESLRVVLSRNAKAEGAYANNRL